MGAQRAEETLQSLFFSSWYRTTACSEAVLARDCIEWELLVGARRGWRVAGVRFEFERWECAATCFCSEQKSPSLVHVIEGNLASNSGLFYPWSALNSGTFIGQTWTLLTRPVESWCSFWINLLRIFQPLSTLGLSRLLWHFRLISLFTFCTLPKLKVEDTSIVEASHWRLLAKSWARSY